MRARVWEGESESRAGARSEPRSRVEMMYVSAKANGAQHCAR